MFNCNVLKTDDVYTDIAEVVEIRFDTSNYQLERPLPNGNNKKIIGLMKYELGRKIMTKFVGLIAKAYSYLIDDSREDKKHKNVCHKKNLSLKIIKTF